MNCYQIKKLDMTVYFQFIGSIVCICIHNRLSQIRYRSPVRYIDPSTDLNTSYMHF